jgi:hypothetical protein
MSPTVVPVNFNINMDIVILGFILSVVVFHVAVAIARLIYLLWNVLEPMGHPQHNHDPLAEEDIEIVTLTTTTRGL